MKKRMSTRLRKGERKWEGRGEENEQQGSGESKRERKEE